MSDILQKRDFFLSRFYLKVRELRQLQNRENQWEQKWEKKNIYAICDTKNANVETKILPR